MSRYAFFFPASWVLRPIDVGSIWSDSRGLTGSEMACIVNAIELARMGNEVYLFTNIKDDAQIYVGTSSVRLRRYGQWNCHAGEPWDALCSWMIPEPLKIAQSCQFKFFNQQCADLDLCEPGWEEYVDIFAPLSNSHAKHMANMTSFPKDKWRVLNNGVYLDKFKSGDKVPGKMIWASSHDRGLHWLLEVFPKIKCKVPSANLHIFYNFDGLRRFIDSDGEPGSELAEISRRARYTLEAIRRLDGKGVFVHESVSRERMRSEMASAEVLAYPLDPVRFTETFGVTVLEACASGVVPILCRADAFGELWGPVSACVSPPYKDHKEEFVDKVIQILSDKDMRSRMSRQCVEYAGKFSWAEIAKRLDLTLKSRGAEGLPKVEW